MTGASLLDGHDPANNIMRRINMGIRAELVHLGHSRSFEEVVTDLQENAEGIEVGGRCSLKQISIALHEETNGISEKCRRSLWA